MGALRASRRTQAARVIRHYGHLLHQNCESATQAEFAAQVFAKGAASMPTDLTPQRAPRSSAALSFLARASIAVVIVGFGLLHVIGGMVMHDHATPRADDTRIPIARGD